MTKRAPFLLIALATAFLTGCGEDTVLPVLNTPDGMLIQDFPIRNGAVWVYENEDDAGEVYRVAVEGTRTISSFVHWKVALSQADATGNPLGEPPPASDFYAANGLHQRLTALTPTPGAFTRAVFVLWPQPAAGETLAFPLKRAAALSPFPVGAVYIRQDMQENLGLLGNEDDPENDPDDTAESERGARSEIARYDEVTTGTVGMILETASEGSDSAQFQKHLPPRRLWQFPMNVGSRWKVFETAALPGGGGRSPQPLIHSERLVAREETVSVPGYSGSALLVEEWVIGLDADAETGEFNVPSLGDSNSDGEIDRGEPTARYWVASGVGIVKYEYEVFDLDLFRQWQDDPDSVESVFVPKTFILTRATIPEPDRGGAATE